MQTPNHECGWAFVLWGPGDDLLSHGQSAISSAQRRFTLLFGMGRGGANALWSPGILEEGSSWTELCIASCLSCGHWIRRLRGDDARDTRTSSKVIESSRTGN